MKRSFAMILFATFAACAALTAAAVWKRDAIKFAFLPPQAKFEKAWRDDLTRLGIAQKLPPQWFEIRAIEVRSEPSPARDWLERTRPPIETKKDGRYKLQLFAIHWIEGTRYGVTLEYALVDLVTGNTVWETARTLKLGFVY